MCGIAGFINYPQGDIEKAKHLAKELKNDKGFYDTCSKICRKNYENSFYNEKNFVPYITDILEGLK